MSPSILLAEDNPDDAILIEMALRGAGVHNSVKLVSDGMQAVDYLTDCIECKSGMAIPGLLLLDILLPRLSGFEVLKWLNGKAEHRSKLHVVMFSSALSPQDIESAKQLGVDEIFEKPLEFAVLRQWMVAIKDRGLIGPV